LPERANDAWDCSISPDRPCGSRIRGSVSLRSARVLQYEHPNPPRRPRGRPRIHPIPTRTHRSVRGVAPAESSQRPPRPQFPNARVDAHASTGFPDPSHAEETLAVGRAKDAADVGRVSPHAGAAATRLLTNPAAAHGARARLQRRQDSCPHASRWPQHPQIRDALFRDQFHDPISERRFLNFKELGERFGRSGEKAAAPRDINCMQRPLRLRSDEFKEPRRLGVL
jgi:hypothetical protein